MKFLIAEIVVGARLDLRVNDDFHAGGILDLVQGYLFCFSVLTMFDSTICEIVPINLKLTESCFNLLDAAHLTYLPIINLHCDEIAPVLLHADTYDGH